MDKQTMAIRYLEMDRLFHMDMLEPIARGTADIVAAEEQGVLLRETVSGAHFLAADTEDVARRMLNAVGESDLMSFHQPYGLDEVERRFGLTVSMRCCQAVWKRPEAPVIADSAFHVERLPESMAEEIHHRYSHDIGLQYIRKRLAAGKMIGAYENDQLAGFAGLHEEGSMGMLEVDPAFRRRGVGTLLFATLIERLLAQKRTPYAQFTMDNLSSRRMHERMGFEITDQTIYWLEKTTP